MLQFCTGTNRVPISGFSSLESNRGKVSKFCIVKIAYEKGRRNYIKANTCFNRLLIPDYQNIDQLLEALIFIINSDEILGFGLES
jgi:hypothetical protein